MKVAQFLWLQQPNTCRACFRGARGMRRREPECSTGVGRQGLHRYISGTPVVHLPMLVVCMYGTRYSFFCSSTSSNPSAAKQPTTWRSTHTHLAATGKEVGQSAPAGSVGLQPLDRSSNRSPHTPLVVYLCCIMGDTAVDDVMYVR